MVVRLKAKVVRVERGRIVHAFCADNLKAITREGAD